MKKPIQLNGKQEWGDTARQQHRFYSKRGAVTVQILLGDRGVTKVLELYEENSMLPDD